MKKIISVLFINLLLALLVNAQDDTRATATWQVQKYDVTANLPAVETDRNLTVKAVLILKNVSGKPASTLTLRISPNATVSAVKINDAAADFAKGEEKTGSGTLQKIVVRVASIQSNGNLTAAVDYKLNVKENSGLNALSPIGSEFLPLSFWYPTPNSWFFARGSDAAPVRLQVNAANGETAVSAGAANGNAFEQKLNGQPFFVTGNWDSISANGVSVFVPKNLEDKSRVNELAQMALDAKTFTATLLGNAPDVPLKIVAVKRGAGFSGDGTMFIDESVLRRQKIDSLTAMTIAEAVAKMWIGGAVSVGGDGFGTVREGLPRYIATLFLENKFGKDVADIERTRQRTAYAAVVKRDAPLNTAAPIDDYYYATVTNKGAMLWRLLAKQIGQNEFFNQIRSQIGDGNLSLSEIRAAFPAQKEFLDYAFDQVTDMNLLAGLPQSNGAETKIALRNIGAIDAAVNVTATTANGEKLTAQTMIPAKKFGEVSFKTNNKIVRAEVDTEKLYPQIDYSDDVAPREFEDSDVIVAVKKAFDQQDYAKAEKNARTVLQNAPRFDDIRTWLGRALAAQGKTAEAEKEFRAVLEEKLPTARSLAWANVGLGEIALKNNQNSEAAKFFDSAVRADADYGATLAARQGRVKANVSAATDESIKNFFVQFDKAAISGSKASVDALIVSGEIPKFSGGVAGAQEWQTKVLQIDKTDADNALVETNLNIKLLNKNAESGTAVFRLARVGGNWKISGVEIFEVR
ncbi:MAG: tetratricopeptide repeat protein [Acidobacteriota bacterium]|nr:tetratricopeptide repeat protein [Acidobacteriota bacterium]